MPLYHYLCTPRRTFSPLQCRISYPCQGKKSASPYLRPREQKNVDTASFRASRATRQAPLIWVQLSPLEDFRGRGL